VKFFAGMSDVNAVKQEYRRLAKLHHPDHGGDTRTMQILNDEYHAALKALDGQVNQGTDGKEHTYRYNYEREQAVMDKIAELLALHLPEDVTLELIGTWVWVHGNTRPIKDKLADAGCIWHGIRQMWYWRQATYSRKFSHKDFDDLRRSFGSQVYREEREESRQIAA